MSDVVYLFLCHVETETTASVFESHKTVQMSKIKNQRYFKGGQEKKNGEKTHKQSENHKQKPHGMDSELV